MPIKSGKMNPGEAPICARLMEFRKSIGWEREPFAAQIELTHDRLASIELGRTPLRYDVAWRIHQVFGISLTWLARGNYPPNERDFDPWPDPKTLTIPRLLLSEAYAMTFLMESDSPHSKKQFSLFPNRQMALNILKDDLVDWMSRVPESRIEEFCQLIVKSAEDLLDDWPQETPPKIKARKKTFMWGQMKGEINKRLAVKKGKNILYNEIALNDIGAVKSEIHSLSELIAAIKHRTNGHGQRAALARELNVSRQLVNGWLSGNSQPTAEITFRLLQWVKQTERKQ
ncbi:MAG TPA: helix-turn-helix transcriptional regulator [Verrucomicrobiae bacterium]